MCFLCTTNSAADDPSVLQPVFTITENAPTRAFIFTFKTIWRNYAKQTSRIYAMLNNLWGQCLCLDNDSTSRRSQLGEGPSRNFQPGGGSRRGLLRDCKTSPINRLQL